MKVANEIKNKPMQKTHAVVCCKAVDDQLAYETMRVEMLTLGAAGKNLWRVLKTEAEKGHAFSYSPGE
jgi:hypothetical protein